MDSKENPSFCPRFVEISQSFNLKAPVCPNSVRRNEDGEIVSICPKVPENCLLVADIVADVEASATVETDAELEQELLIQKWLKEQGISPSSLT